MPPGRETAEPPAHLRVLPVTAGTDADACARTILSTLTRRAYRRPVTDADVAPLLALYHEGRGAGRIRDRHRARAWRLLVSPEFLFRVEVDPADVAPGAAYRISDSSWRRGCRSSSGAASRTTSCSTSR